MRIYIDIPDHYEKKNCSIIKVERPDGVFDISIVPKEKEKEQ